jgi:WD40 repeat protein
LESALKRFGKPWYKLWAARLFRDKSNLPVSHALWSVIEQALGESEYFLLMASPEAAGSEWVQKEVAYWKEKRSAATLLIALTGGDLRWAGADFDWDTTDAIPKLLKGAFADEPRHVDLRWARSEEQLSSRHPRFREDVADIAAALHGISKDEMIGEEIRQHRRTMAIARGVGVALLSATAVSLGLYAQAIYRRDEARASVQIAEADSRRARMERDRADKERDRANKERDEALLKTRLATAIRLATESRATRERSPQQSVLLAVEALRATYPGDPLVPEAEQSFRDALANCSGFGLGGHEGAVRAVTFSRDGRRLATAGDDGAVRIWGLSDSGPVGPPVVQQLRVYLRFGGMLAFSPDGRRLVACNRSNETRVWDLGAGGSPLPSVVLRSERALADVDALSPDGSRLAANERLRDEDELRASVWDLTAFDPSPQAKLVVRGPFYKAFHSAAFSPDNRWLVATSKEPVSDIYMPNAPVKVRVWDLSAAHATTPAAVLPADPFGIDYIRFSHDGCRLVLGGENGGFVDLWEMAQVVGRPSPKAPHSRLPTGRIYTIAFGPDGSRLVTDALASTPRGFVDHRVVVWDLTAPDPVKSAVELCEGKEAIRAISRDGRRIVTKRTDRPVRVWDLSAPNPTKSAIELTGHDGEIKSAAFSPDGRRLATGDDNGVVRAWDLSLVDPAGNVAMWPGLEGAVTALAFDERGRWLAGASDGGSTRLWDLKMPPGTVPGTVVLGGSAQSGAGSSTDITAAITGDSRWLGTCGGVEKDYAKPKPANAAYLWDLKAPDPSRSPVVLGGYHHPVATLAMSPDDRWLATADDRPGTGHVVRLWDLKSPGPTPGEMTLKAGNGRINSAGNGRIHRFPFSPDGRWLAVAAGEHEDVTARIWDLNDPATRRGAGVPKPVAKAPPDGGFIGAPEVLKFSPDGRWLVGRHYSRVYLWALRDGAAAEAPHVLEGHGRPLIELDESVFSPDGHWLVTVGGSDGSTRLLARFWDLSRDDPARDPMVLEDQTGTSWRPWFSRDGRWMVVGDRSAGLTCRVWDLTAQDPSRPVAEIRTGLARAFHAWMSPDGRWVAVVNDVATRLYDLTAPDPSRSPIVLRGYGEGTGRAVFDPEGRWVASGRLLWDLKASDPSRSAVAFHQVDREALFSPDGRWLICQGWYAPTRLWPLRREEVLDLAQKAVGRNFHAEEWDRSSPGRPYRRTFDGLPESPSLVRSLVRRAQDAAASGDAGAAAGTFAEAAALAVRIGPPRLCDQVCRQGCLAGFPREVLPAGEHATGARPDLGPYRDTQGLARALTGDRAGAAADFLAYADWARRDSKFEYDRKGPLREKWAAELNAGRDPFDAATLEKLRAEE